jgi:hypothetical protein
MLEALAFGLRHFSVVDLEVGRKRGPFRTAFGSSKTPFDPDDIDGAIARWTVTRVRTRRA